MPNPFSSRQKKLRRLLNLEKLDLLLVTDETNVSYLTGFTGDSSYLVIGPDRAQLVSDARFSTQIDEECPGLETYIRPPKVRLNEATVATLKKWRPRRAGIEAHVLSVETLAHLMDGLPDTEFVALSGMIESELRAIKDAAEIADIREAVQLATRGFEFLKAILTPDMTEREAAFELEHAVRRFGGERLSFPPILAVGDRAALPHYRPTTNRMRDAPLLLVDWGVQTVGGYVSDLTRTLVTGKATKKLETIYNVVLDAQQQAIAAIRPGVTGGELDAIARGVIEKAGYGRRFGHSLGHGIGRAVHESPRLAPGVDVELAAGMVVTVEPGVYLPGWGGVRIEDDVLVTREGCEVLSAAVPNSFEDMVLG